MATQPLQPQLRQRVERLQQIYDRFKDEMNAIERDQNAVIRDILQRVDHKKTEEILTQLHKQA